jgi:HEAT repeat protein
MSDPAGADCLERVAHLANCPTVTPADVEFLVGCLGSPGKALQRRAADAISAAAARGVAVTDRLLRALADPSPNRRWGAAYTLGLLGPPPEASLPTLFESMGFDDGDVRWAAAEILKRAGSLVLPRLVELATSGTPAQRKMAFYCLRDMAASADLVETAVLVGLRDEHVEVRLAALSAITQLMRAGDLAQPEVLRMVDDSDPRVRRAAMSCLGSLGPPTHAVLRVLREATSSTDAGLRRAAAHSLKLLGTPPGGHDS